LYHAYCKPSKLVAVELSTKPVAALEDYIVKKECRDTIKPYYGINQADRKVLSILEDEFPGRDIDLVVDDASHLYHESKESFNMIFPYLRPGGLYIIEDWAWSHTSLWQGENAKWSDKPALTNLIFEIIMACPSTTDMIEEIVIDKNNAFIYKGDSAIQSNEFDISKSYINRGKEFVPFL
jgi:SAM-dependent methyltransferase